MSRFPALLIVLIASGCARAPQVIVEDDDHVIVQGLHECHFKCNGFSHRRSVEFMSEFQRRLSEGDRQSIADLVGYPLRVNGPIPMNLKNRARLLREFESVFTPAVIEETLAADPRLVFCNWQGIMLGRGVIWADSGKEGPYLVRGINQPDGR